MVDTNVLVVANDRESPQASPECVISCTRRLLDITVAERVPDSASTVKLGEISLSTSVPVPVEQGQSRMSKTPKASGPGQSGDLDYCARGGAGSLRPSLFSSGLSGARLLQSRHRHGNLPSRQRARNRHPRNGQH